jgi:hypothetical protein
MFLPTLPRWLPHANISTMVTGAEGKRCQRELTRVTMLDRISIEVTNRCAKACWFCYECRWNLSENPG